MKPVQYIIADAEIGRRMSKGKFGAQAAHASVEGLRLNAKSEWGNPWDTSIVNRWYRANHYTKIVLMADDLHTTYAYITDRGIPMARIIDEGRTEFDGALTLTMLGSPVVDKDVAHVAETFGTFRLYEEPQQPKVIIIETDRLDRDTVERIRAAADAGDLERAKLIAHFARSWEPNDEPRRRWFRR